MSGILPFAVPVPDLLTFARTIKGEAEAEPLIGKIAVGWTIRNRVDADILGDGKPDWWGEGYEQVCRAPYQFSCWLESDPNRKRIEMAHLDADEWFVNCFGIACAIIGGQLPDPTAGATHYFAYRIIQPPAWVDKFILTKQIGGHKFYKDPTAFLPLVG